MEIRTTAPMAIVGAGTMGVGIAQVAATAGHSLIVLDRDRDALDRGRAHLVASLDAALAKGRITGDERSAIVTRIGWSTDVADAATAMLVIEAIVENLAVKRQLFEALETIVAADAILASNTSSLGIGDIAAALSRPGRFIGLHFFNPVPAMKLVEIVAGPATGAAAIDAATTLMLAWRKQPVRVTDVPGFIVNRVARPYYAEGFLALSEGIAPETIDAALTGSGGFRMGALALADMIGHDVNFAVASSVHDAGVGAPRFRPQAPQRALVEKGALGRKSGAGVYDYAAALPAPACHTGGGSPKRVSVSDAGPLQPIANSAVAAGIAVDRDDALPSGILAVDGTLVALSDGRPLAARGGIDVLIDQPRDFEKASTIVLTARTPDHADRASDLFRAIGRQVLVMEDRPGLLVLRTLAQIANAAADTVWDRIASTADVDLAMLYGANHPEGPLAWAQRIGHERVRTVLRNIADATDDPLYAPSPFFDGHPA